MSCIAFAMLMRSTCIVLHTTATLFLENPPACLSLSRNFIMRRKGPEETGREARWEGECVSEKDRKKGNEAIPVVVGMQQRDAKTCFTIQYYD